MNVGRMEACQDIDEMIRGYRASVEVGREQTVRHVYLRYRVYEEMVILYQITDHYIHRSTQLSELGERGRAVP